MKGILADINVEGVLVHLGRTWLFEPAFLRRLTSFANAAPRRGVRKGGGAGSGVLALAFDLATSDPQILEQLSRATVTDHIQPASMSRIASSVSALGIWTSKGRPLHKVTWR